MPYKNLEKRAEKNKEYLKKHYNSHKEHYAKRNDRIRKRNYDWFKNLKKTLYCEICGENRPDCLDFHHLDPNEKEVGIPIAINRMWSIGRIEKEIKKCQVVCANCHRIIHSKN